MTTNGAGLLPVSIISTIDGDVFGTEWLRSTWMAPEDVARAEVAVMIRDRNAEVGEYRTIVTDFKANDRVLADVTKTITETVNLG